MEKKLKKESKKTDYTKYRWFYTKSGKLVYGGKSAEQNEEIVRKSVINLDPKKKYNKEFGQKKPSTYKIVMHTRIPGSPFAIVDSSSDKITKADLEETAIWTACFSRAWRTKLKKTTVDVFTTEQIVKRLGMKPGTFGVIGKIDRIDVELKLVLSEQKGILRAIPENSTKDKALMTIIPGDIPKEQFAKEIAKKFKKTEEEVLNALPTGSFKELKNR